MAVAAVKAVALRRLLAPLAIFLALAALVVQPFGLSWPCPTRTLLGVPCPTCGMTRAARLVAHGDLAAATHMHPLWFVVLPLVGGALAIEVVEYVRTGAWGASMRVPGGRAISLGVLALLIGVWIARFFGAFGGPVPR